MTTPIPIGTCNVPINFLNEERFVIQKLAYSRNLSVNEYLRRVIRRGVAFSNPLEAKQLAKLRRSRAAALLVLFLCWLTVGDSNIQRSPFARGRREDMEVA